MNATNLGFFQLIRESVKRSILLGFSDAVEQLGAPAEGSELHPQLAAMLRPAPAAALEHTPGPRVHAKPERKRLGRSLEQLQSSSAKQAPGPAAS
jgi:hypothetical protein